MLVDLSVTIMQVTVSVAVMQLEVSAAHMQVTVSAANQCCGQRDCNARMIRNCDYEIQTSFALYLFVILLLLCLYYGADLINKLELCLLVTLFLNKD